MDTKIAKKDTGIYVTCTTELKERLREMANRHGRTMSGEMNYLILRALESEGERNDRT